MTWSTKARSITGASTTNGRRFMDLPRRTSQPFELAMKVEDPADRQRLENHGWKVVPSFRMSLDIFGEYQAYFRRSRASLPWPRTERAAPERMVQRAGCLLSRVR